MNYPLPIALLQAAHRIEDRLEEALSAVNLSGAKFAVLAKLVANEQPMSLSELAEKLTCVRSNVTQLADRLEVEGLIKRTDDPADRRAIRAEVTRLGRERYAAGEKVVSALFKEITSALSGVDAKVLQRALEALR